MALPQVNYQAGFLPQGAYDQINRNIAQGGQGLLQAMLAKQQREMKTLDMFGDAVGGAVNRSREDKKLARDSAKETYDRDMGLARKELDSFKVGSSGYQKASEKIKDMQAKRDSALQAFDDQGFFSRDDSVLNIGPEKKEIREDRLADANKYYKSAEGFQKLAGQEQDQVNALRSGGGMLARNIAMQRPGMLKEAREGGDLLRTNQDEIKQAEEQKKKIEEELQGPQNAEKRKERTQSLDELISRKRKENIKLKSDQEKRVSTDERDQSILKSTTSDFAKGAESKQSYENQMCEAMTKATLAENDTSVPEGKFRSALTGELYDTADLRVDEARDFQININKENEKQQDEDKAFGIQLKAISEIQDPKDYETEINKIPDEKLSRDVKDSMILAHRQGVKTNSLDAVLRLKSVYGGDQKGFFNHVKNAVDADGNKLFPGFEGINYNDDSEKSFTQSLVTKAASSGSLTDEQIRGYAASGIFNDDQADALIEINQEVKDQEILKNSKEAKVKALQAANVMGGQALINEYIKQGYLPQGTQFKDEKRIQAYKMSAIQALVEQGDPAAVLNLMQDIPEKDLPTTIKNAITDQAQNRRLVLDKANQFKETADGRDKERLQLAIDAANRSGNMQNLRMEIMRAAESRAEDTASRQFMQELRAEERATREVQNQTYGYLKDTSGVEAAYEYLISVRPELSKFSMGATDFEKLERSVRFKVSSGQGTITQDEADAYGVDKTSLQASVDEKKDNVELQKLSQKLLRGTEFVGEDAETEARLLGFKGAKEANNYIKFERNGLITRRLDALGNNYKEIEELQKTVGKNTGGVDFKTRITEAKQGKAQDKVNKLYDNLFRTAHLGATDLVDSTFNSMTTQDFEFKELQKQNFISGDVVKKLKKSFKEVEKIKHDKVLIERRTQGISEVESYLGQYYGANDEGKKELRANMTRVNNEKMLGFDIDSLISTQTASTKLKLAKDKAIAEKAVIDLKRAALDEANRLKTEKGELSTEDIKKITTNLVQAKLKNPYDPNVNASEIVKGVDSIKTILNIFAQTGKVEFDETELDEEP